MKHMVLSAHIKKKLKISGVQTLLVFGSHARGDAHAMSDIDVGVILSDIRSYDRNPLKIYNLLYTILSELFPQSKQIDIVFLQKAPLLVARKALIEGSIVYQSDNGQLEAFRESIYKQYVDFHYFLTLKQNALLSRI